MNEGGVFPILCFVVLDRTEGLLLGSFQKFLGGEFAGNGIGDKRILHEDHFLVVRHSVAISILNFAK